jgi:hypothetical protein
LEFLHHFGEISNFDATLLLPSIKVDEVWHKHILNTEESHYNVRQDLMIHHNPEGALEGQ